MKKRKEPLNFACKECGKKFTGNKEQSNKNWCVCTKDDICECGGEYELVFND
uniref:hypothetical protein n=1 Tax=Clostridium sp. 12(A) TaxID=1163671 RepID=UPI0012DC3DAF|nr:hypothetical protein [Clostridium sp. 12(A)]